MKKREKEFFINIPGNSLPASVTTDILAKHDPLLYHSQLHEYKPTPIIGMKELAATLGVGSIYIKDESHRFHLNAFKALGASFAINQILKNTPEIETFCTATDGNHGRAVAWAAKMAGRKSVVFVPAGTSPSRIEAIEAEGATVSEFSGNYDKTCNHARKVSSKNGWKLVQDTSEIGYEEIPALIMAGYTTIFREMESSLNGLPKPLFDIIFLQAGVGSFAASAIWYYLSRYGANRPKIVLVEPSESDGVLESFKQGRRSEPRGSLNTIMTGLNCGIPSLNAWEIIRHGVDAVLRIDDRYAIDAVKRLYHPGCDDTRIVAGESGAAGLAGLILLRRAKNLKIVANHIQLTSESKILLINSEGATDPVNFKLITGCD
jgi:diaminopropionate ammonia-lyase